ncbi:MAG: DNA integrity scanning protein DisA nucleotide-binding domain protein [Halobacteriota archaeon]|jgi:DNA integrity scanning protein DisA with diadenylate cyclase activity
MDQIFTAITTAANALAKMVNATHVFVISDMPCNEVPFDVPTTFITTSTLANGVNDELRDFLREGGTRTFNASIVAPVLNDFSLVKDVATAAYIDDIVDGGFVLGVLCLSQLSSIVVFDVKQLATVKTIDKTGERVDPTALKAVLRLALELGREGREGKKVGTAFIIGDTNEVLKRSHQLILNPYKGHSEDTRDIKNRSHWETIKEFAQIDGVFIVDDKGVIISAGRYLDVNTKSIELGGFGGRHISALAVTRETQAIAVTVSESGGTVRLFKDGIETKIESSADLLMLLL